MVPPACAMRRSGAGSKFDDDYSGAAGGPDMPALCLGQYRQARDDVSPGLVGMIGVRVEPTGRYGVILAGLNGLAA